MMSSMNMVMELFGDAVGFIDQSLQLQSDIMSDTAAVKYNLWTKLTAHFRNKRIIRNNVNRLNSLSVNILAKYKMANDMATSLQKVAQKLKGLTKKMQPKKAAGRSGGESLGQYTDATKYLADRRSARGEEPAPTAPAGASAPTGGLDVTGI